MSESSLSYVIPGELDGSRLDKAIVELAQGMSRARIKRAIEARGVRVNGRIRPKGTLVVTGDVLTLEPDTVASPDTPATPEPDAPLTVLHESATVIVVDKPAGQPTAPLRHGEKGTLANALVGHYPEVAGIGYSPRDPGLVHRLDTDTSGLIVAARNADTFEAMKDALKGDKLQKRYQLVCRIEGLPDEGTIEFPLTNHPKDQRRVYACIHPRDVERYAPKPAATSYEILEAKGQWALVEVTVARALRHQIRAHFAALGHPLAGDTLYGGEYVKGLERHALHASRITFTGVLGIAPFDVISPLPADMRAVLDTAE